MCDITCNLAGMRELCYTDGVECSGACVDGRSTAFRNVLQHGVWLQEATKGFANCVRVEGPAFWVPEVGKLCIQQRDTCMSLVRQSVKHVETSDGTVLGRRKFMGL